jgi:hypothetical protein
MARAATLLELVTAATDEGLKLSLAVKAADWTALALAVRKMEEWEARLIGDENTPGAWKSSLLD